MLQYSTEQMRKGGALTKQATERNLRLKKGILEAEQAPSYEMAILTREAYELFSEEPWRIRRAQALRYFYEKMTIYIREGELIVGNRSERPGALPRIPDGLHRISREFCDNAPFPAGEFEERWELRDVFEEYWDLLPEQTRRVEQELVAGLAPGSHEGFGHIIADYEYIIRYGIKSLFEKIDARMEKLGEDDVRQRDFLRSVRIAWSGVALWAERYADLAAQKAQALEKSDPAACAELRQIEATCRRVPMEPARTFREALQAFWFVQQSYVIEQKAGSISVSGLDRYLIDYLRRDIAEGVLTWAEADELVDGFCIKFMENAIWPNRIVQFANMSLGGMDENGEDATNELSFLLLNSQLKIRSNAPMVSVRWHEKINREFWLLAHESIRTGSGLPALFGDKPMIEALEGWGLPHHQAVEYGVVGCVEPSVKGETMGATIGGHINAAKCLELALNHGRAFISGCQLGPDTGSLESFRDLEDVITSYSAQVESAIRYDVECVNAAAKAQRDRFSYPIMSGTMHGCIESAKDMTDGGCHYNYPTICAVGVPDVVDSLLALEEVLFVQKKVTPHRLLVALHTDFAGEEPLRQLLFNTAERYGSGCRRAVALFNRVCSIQYKAAAKYSGPRGDYFDFGLWPVELHVRFGKKTGALPSGRKAGEPLADGNGACHGSDRRGPTALLQDVAGIEAAHYWSGGYTFNMRVLQNIMKEPEDLEKFSQLTETFFRLGGMQLQVNTLSADTLRKAQQDPASYSELIVRVAGYSAYFVNLSRDLQNEIITRTSHGL